jgi:hypothetical protein
MKQYTVYPCDGGKPTVSTSTKGWALEQLQHAVGGYIEIVPAYYYKDAGQAMPFRPTVYVNEEGRLLGLPRNPWFPLLVGNVLVEGTIKK